MADKESFKLLFVLPKNTPDESQASKIMRGTFEACQQTVKDVIWVKEEELVSQTLDKTDFIVFEEFQGKAFEEIKIKRCISIVGPWAVRVCLIEAKKIPNFTWPIFNVAMYDCVVTCSHLPKARAMIQERVQLMGGYFSGTLSETTTHLVSNTVKSQKYSEAAKCGIKIMSLDWVEEVWKASQDANVHANEERFMKFRCLPLASLNICSTGLNLREKAKIEKLVEENGGKFTGQLALNETDFLICAGNLSTSKKFKGARSKKIKCVKVDWLYDSIKNGYACDETNYVITISTSTPTKSGVNPEFSILSAINDTVNSERPFSSHVEDTLANSPLSNQMNTLKRKVASKLDFGDPLDNLDIKKVKKAGHYLDGCSIYITGFTSEQTDKLNKIINLSGATRYDTYSDRVTHILTGHPIPAEVQRILQSDTCSAHVVTVHWLIDSSEQGHPASEDKYLLGVTDLEATQPGSPLSKRGLNLLRSHRTITEEQLTPSQDEVEQEDNTHQELVQQYLNPASSCVEDDSLAKMIAGAGVDFSKLTRPSDKEKKTSVTSRTEDTLIESQNKSSDDGVFNNLKFQLIGFDDEVQLSLSEMILSLSGVVVQKGFKGVPDYAVVPIVSEEDSRISAGAIVNELFIMDCAKNEELRSDLLYYHRPIVLPETQPLANCVITLSSYIGTEKIYLKRLIEGLGGLNQDQLVRVANEDKGLAASTHLVALEPTGKKYMGALKWSLPVVDKGWLLECAKTGRYVEEECYLIGDSTASRRVLSSGMSVISTPSRVNNTSLQDPPEGKNPVTPFVLKTPLIRKKCVDSDEKPFSQVTPIGKIMQDFRGVNPDAAPKTPKEYVPLQPWMNMKTPETPLGAFLTPNPSPNTRKEWAHWLSQFTKTPPTQSNQSTPISEIKRQLWAKIRHDSQTELNVSESGTHVTETDAGSVIDGAESQEHPQTPEQLVNRLEMLEQMLSSNETMKRHSRNLQGTTLVPAVNSAFKDSLPCTVGWDYQHSETPASEIKIFNFTGITDVTARNLMTEQIESLGGAVSSLAKYDPTCTHLLTPKANRNEKMLSWMAAGKWILHVSYLERSVEAGKFLNEEEFEFGNPKAANNIPSVYDKDVERRCQQIHWWRVEISKRGYGAFHNIRAMIVASSAEAIKNVILAGGGKVIDVGPPPFEDHVPVTHCLLDQRSVDDLSEYEPLARQGVYVVPLIFINDYLQNPHKDIKDCVIPYFAKYCF